MRLALGSFGLLPLLAGCVVDAPPTKTAHAHVAPRFDATKPPPNMVMLDFQTSEAAPAPTIQFDPPPPARTRLHETLTIGKNNPDQTYELERSAFEPEPVAYDDASSSMFASDSSYAFARGGGGHGGHHGRGGNNPGPSSPTPRVGGNWPTAPAFGPPAVLFAPGK